MLNQQPTWVKCEFADLPHECSFLAIPLVYLGHLSERIYRNDHGCYYDAWNNRAYVAAFKGCEFYIPVMTYGNSDA